MRRSALGRSIISVAKVLEAFSGRAICGDAEKGASLEPSSQEMGEHQ
jgi:hypothetical protein